jgi:PAS domain S-box-containing protein
MKLPSTNPETHKKLKKRLIFQVSGFVALVMLLVTALFAFMMNDNLTQQLRSQLKVSVQSAKVLLEQRIDYLMENTERLTTNPFVVNGLVDTEGRKTYLPKLIENFAKGRDVLSFVLVDYDGRPLFQTVDDVPNYNDSTVLRNALARGERTLFIQQPHNQLVIVAPISYYDTTQGAVIVAFDLPSISKRYLLHESHAYYRLLYGETVLAEHDYVPGKRYIRFREFGSAQTPLLKQLEVSIEIGLPESTYLAPVWHDILRLILVSLLLILAAVLVSAAIGNSIAQPILTLHRRVREIDVDAGSHCSPLGTDDELEDLASAFDQRTAALLAIQIELERDIAARTEAQRELEHLRHYLQNIIDSMPSLLIGVDDEGRVTHWNKQAAISSGISAEQAQGKGLAQVMPILSSQMKRVRKAIREHQPQLISHQVHLVDEENHFADITIYPLVANAAIGAVIRVDDITERVRMEEMMMQTEKMMSVGGLAAGMAHEINNPLGGILQGLQNIQRRFSPELKANLEAAHKLNVDLGKVQAYMENRQILHFMEEMANAGKRASDIVTNMLQFSRKAELTLSPEEINELVDKTLDLAAVDYDLKKKYDFRQIEIIRDYDPNLPAAPCIASEIQQVLLNLLRNAAQALQHQKEPKATPRIIARTRAHEHAITIEIEDNGPGMEEAVRARIFEPFFTTRPVGEGTGLGLSVSYFIIHDEHGGQMDVISRPGEGATFTITLPWSTKAADKVTSAIDIDNGA